jgi:hypothetical protein
MKCIVNIIDKIKMNEPKKKINLKPVNKFMPFSMKIFASAGKNMIPDRNYDFKAKRTVKIPSPKV